MHLVVLTIQLHQFKVSTVFPFCGTGCCSSYLRFKPKNVQLKKKKKIHCGEILNKGGPVSIPLPPSLHPGRWMMMFASNRRKEGLGWSQSWWTVDWAQGSLVVAACFAVKNRVKGSIQWYFVFSDRLLGSTP